MHSITGRSSRAGGKVGFERVLAMLSSIRPALARDLLKEQTKESDAVQLLLKMDENRAKKIVNECQTPADKAWIGKILDKINHYGRNEDAEIAPDSPS